MIDRSHLMGTYAEPPVTFVSGEGSWLVDENNMRYLDLLCGLAVTSLGHARPEVAQAIASQAARLNHVSNLFGNEVGPQVASLLDGLLYGATGHHGKVFFGNSGAEANECALKLARRVAPGKHLVISTLDSFHGRTLATLTATGQPAKHTPFEPLPTGFAHVAYGDLGAAEAALASGEVAAVLVEVIQAEGGINVPPTGYLPALEAACRKAGARPRSSRSSRSRTAAETRPSGAASTTPRTSSPGARRACRFSTGLPTRPFPSSASSSAGVLGNP